MSEISEELMLLLGRELRKSGIDIIVSFMKFDTLMRILEHLK